MRLPLPLERLDLGGGSAGGSGPGPGRPSGRGAPVVGRRGRVEAGFVD